MEASEEVVACMLVHVLLPFAGIYLSIYIYIYIYVAMEC